MFKLPDSKRFSKTQPSGISMRWPSFATTKEERAHTTDKPRQLYEMDVSHVLMTVPRKVTFLQKFTSPVTVKWSSSMILGIFLKRFWNCWIC
jgi:hypothetical protein